jgi:hypothetical protein
VATSIFGAKKNCFSNFLTGKLQIRASGRAQLIVGNMAMDIDFGTQELIL